MALAARDNITLRSEAEDHTQSSKNKSGSGEIGFSIGAQTGWYVSASTAKGKGSGNGTTHVETVVDADRNLTVISGKDTTLQGAQLSGDKVVASIGGNLSIISEQDTDDYASKQTQAGGTFVYGSGGSVNIGQQKVESHLRSVQEQSGIVAGSGGFNIAVGGNTHLEGGVIGSTADASKNRLDTGSLTVVDIENESRAKTSGGGIGTGMSSGGGISNPLGSVAGAGLSLLGGTKKNDSSTTRSDIAAGTVVVRDGNESALAGLDRTATGFDTDSALSAVDLRKMQERAEVMQLGGQLLFKGVGDLGGYLSQKAETEEGKAFWADGGNGRALLHGMAGAAMAALGGADALNGAVSAAGAEKAKKAISDYLTANQSEISPEQFRSLMEVSSAMVGGLAGGSTGANIALTGDRFNRQLHLDEAKKLDALKQGKTADEQQRLNDAMCALVHCSAGVPDSDPNKAQLEASEKRGRGYAAEQQLIKGANAFLGYSTIDQVNDQILRFDESFMRIKGGVQAVGGAAGAVGATAGAVATTPGCGTVVLCAAPIGLAGVAVLSAKSGMDGLDSALGPYNSVQGKRVLDSFNASTYQGDQNPLAGAAVSLVRMAAEQAISRVGGRVLAQKELPSRADHVVTNTNLGREGKIDPSRAQKGTREYEILNNPPPNSKVELTNGTVFKTNGSGFVEEITYRPNNIPGTRDGRQTAVGKEGIAGDVGGHIQACRHGGTCDRYNIFPQNSNFNSSAYKKFENEITSALTEGRSVGDVTVKFGRSSQGNARPDTVTVVYNIDGKISSRTFKNEYGGGL
ncbi:TPA: hemagglutinin repeat-containing protein [Stenotrophomonas maltophilia]